MSRNVYKLCLGYSGKDAVYISTDMSLDEVADIYCGFEFYIELNTRYGLESEIDIDVAVYLLCSIFGCTVFDKKKISSLDKYDAEMNDLAESEWIDLYDERERRCGSDDDKYVQQILQYTGNEFVRKLCAYFNSEEVHTRPAGTDFLSPEEIMMKY